MVEDHLSTKSDHATILITVDLQEPPPRLKIGSTAWEKARALLNLPSEHLPIDDIAEKLVSTVQEAIQGASNIIPAGCRAPHGGRQSLQTYYNRSGNSRPQTIYYFGERFPALRPAIGRSVDCSTHFIS